MPKACPYVMMRPPIVVDIIHRIYEGKRDWGIFLFAFSDNLFFYVFVSVLPSIYPQNLYFSMRMEGSLNGMISPYMVRLPRWNVGVT